MLGWWGILFGFGLLAFLDSFLDFGALFRQSNSAVFLLVALGLLVRIIHKSRQRTVEKLTDRVTHLERELEARGQGDAKVEDNDTVAIPQPAAVA